MIAIVSGIPRSGTSLVMQMLKAGGMAILSDHVRKADENNVRGYYEYEKVKSLMTDNSWLGQAQGKAVKIIAPLIRYLPDEFEYAVIFMERDMREIVSSQNTMLEKLGGKSMSSNTTVLMETFSRQIATGKKFILEKDNFRTLDLCYHDIILDPARHAQEIDAFLQMRLAVNKMAEVVEPNLYRTRMTNK